MNREEVAQAVARGWCHLETEEMNVALAAAIVDEVMAVVCAESEADATRGTLNGAERIAQERHRQIVMEEWTPDHDVGHDQGELAQAAACYAAQVAKRTLPGGPVLAREDDYDAPDDWPWDEEWWKPTTDDPVRQLMKAGALIAAEIDRLQAAQRRVRPRLAGSRGLDVQQRALRGRALQQVRDAGRTRPQDGQGVLPGDVKQ